MAEEITDLLVTTDHKELDPTSMSNNSDDRSPVSSANSRHDTHAHQLRSSLDSYLNEGGSNSNSAQKQKTSDKSQRRIPSFLRASSGSCHDLCKYGRRNAPEEKPWKVPRRRTAKKSSQTKLDSVEITVSDMQKEDTFMTHEGSADTKERISSEGSETRSYSPELQSCPNLKSDSSKLKTPLDAKSYSLGKGKNADSGKKAHLHKHKSSPSEKSPQWDPPEIIKKQITAEKTYNDDHQSMKLSSSLESKGVKVRSSSSSFADNGAIIKGRRNPNSKTGRSMTASRDFGKEESAPLSKKFGKLNRRNNVDIEMSDDGVSAKTLHVIEKGSAENISESITDRDDIAPVESSSLSTNEEDEETRRTVFESDGIIPNNDVAVEVGNTQPIKERQNKTLRKSRKVVVSDDKYRSPGKSKFTSGKVVDTKKLQSRSARTINAKADKDVPDRRNESVETGKEQSVKEKQNRTQRKNGVAIISEDKHRPPVKLKFRLGKVVNPTQENMTPWRLKFRRPKPINNEADKSMSGKSKSTNRNDIAQKIGNVQDKDKNKPQRLNKVVGGSEEKYRSPINIYRNGKVVDPPPSDYSIITKRLRFRSVRPSGIEGSKNGLKIKTLRTSSMTGKDDGTEISGKKYKLKHQNVQAKKDAQVLLNNVIEETASKLVESRKSKVKALVGAFETVISLQEGKSSSYTASAS